MAELQCDGWWEQDFYGRQPMQSLSLSFDSGVITGSGTDIVGPFTFDGTLDRGTVTMKKQYVDRHSVVYVGSYDGEGTMQGQWQIDEFRGTWMIRIRSGRSNHQSGEPIEQIKPPQRSE